MSDQPNHSNPPEDSGKNLWFLMFMILGFVIIFWWTTRPAPALEGWYTDYADAQLVAQQNSKPMLLAFSMNSCPPCREMERDILPNQKVAAALCDFVPAKLDMFKNIQLARKYAVPGAPTYIVTDEYGELISSAVGPHSVNEFVRFLDDAKKK